MVTLQLEEVQVALLPLYVNVPERVAFHLAEPSLV